MKILLIGPQGSGKSTQGKLLAEYLKIPYISTGDIFREISSQDTKEGKRIKQILEAGQLVDDETTDKLVKERLQRTDSQNGFILDGYPRNLQQLDFLVNNNLNLDKVIYIQIPDEVVIERLMQRGRKDDTPDIIKTRLNVYKDKTQSLVSLFKSEDKLTEINGQGTVEEIQQKVRDYLS